MKYTPNTIIKAVVAVVVAAIGAAAAGANGLDLEALDLGQWLTVIGTGLVAGGAVFHKPNKTSETANDKAAASVGDVVAKAAEAHQQLAQTAVDSIRAVQEAAGDLSKLLPGPIGPIVNDVALAADALNQVWQRPLGALASQVVNGLPAAYSQAFDPATQPWNR